MSSTGERYVVEVTFEIEKDAEGFPKSRDFEALLCEPLNPDCSLCKVASVPFYLRNVAYGDTISANDDPSRGLRFSKVLSRGGYSVYRILLHNAKKRDDLIDKLFEFNGIVEQEGNLIAFALPHTANFDKIVGYILKGKQKGYWGAQDGFIFEPV